MYDNTYFGNREESAMQNRHYNGDGSQPNDNFYNGNGYYPADAMNQQVQQNMQQGADAAKPYVILVANSTTNNVTATILDANNQLLPTATNFGNTAAVTITMQNGNLNYGQWLGQYREKPFRVAQTFQTSANTSQPFQSLNFTTFDTFGASTTYARVPILNLFQNQNGGSCLDYPFTVDGNTKITFTLLASASVTIQFFPNKVYNISHGLSGRNVNMQMGNPRINGVPYLAPQAPGVSTPMVQIGAY